MSSDSQAAAEAPTLLPSRILELAVRVCLWLVCLLVIGRLASVLMIRLRYPYELEWMEGSVLDQVRRLESPRPLYGPPTVEFVPLVYPPLYYIVVSAIGKVVGLGFFAARLLSLVSSVAVHVLVAAIAFRETRSWTAALVGVALFSATFGLSGAWFDLARIDSLCWALWLGAAYVVRFGRSWKSILLGGALLALACFTKQTAASVAMPVLLFALLVNLKRGVLAVATFAISLAVAIFATDQATGHWFNYYVFGVPKLHELRWELAEGTLLNHFYHPLAILIVFSLGALAGPIAAKGWRVWLLYAGLLGAAFTASFASFIKAGGFDNAFMPFHIVLALMTAISVGWLSKAPTLAAGWRAVLLLPAGATRWRAALFAYSAVLLHFAVTRLDLEPYTPTEKDEAAVASIIDELKRLPSPMCVPSTGFYAAMAGHDDMCAHDMSLFDMFTIPESPATASLMRDSIKGLRERRWASIAIGRSHGILPQNIMRELHRNYRFEKRISNAVEGLPRTGFRVMLEEIWVPIGPPRQQRPR